MVLLFGALAAPPLYNDDDLRVRADTIERDALVALAQQQEQHGIHFVLDGMPKPAEALPFAALVLAWMASQDQRAQEYDLWVPNPTALEPVSLRITGDHWRLTTGNPVARQVPNFDQALAGAGLRRAGSVPWESEVAGAIAEALVLLSPAERAAIEGVRLQRVPGTPMRAGGPAVATYLGDGAKARIEVYDPAAAPTVRFVGKPFRPYHPTSLVVLHEIAHAIADRSTRGLVRGHDQDRSAVVAARQAMSRDVDAHNAAIAAYRANPEPAEGLRLQRAGAELNERAAALERDLERLNQGALQVNAQQQGTAIGAAYWNALGKAPTRYGQASPDEAFAEAFALYKLDPEALEHLIPGAVAWFQRGSHTATP